MPSKSAQEILDELANRPVPPTTRQKYHYPIPRRTDEVREPQISLLGGLGLLLGVFGLVLNWLGPIAFILGLLALINIAKAPQKYSGNRLAVAAIVLGALDVLFMIMRH